MKLHGARVPHKKNTALMKAEPIALPKEVIIPMSMHIGKPARIAVKRGDTVKVGTIIGEPEGYVSSPVYSSVSGKVVKTDEISMGMGAKVPAVLIETDGLQEVSEDIAPPKVEDYEGFIEAVRKSGVVGLGGAGFPTFIKLKFKDFEKLDAVVINAAECEPYITSDTRTILDNTEYLFKGIEALKKYMEVTRFIFGVENNKPECINKLREYFKDDSTVEVKALPAVYPQGGEKVLVYNTMKRIIPKGGFPLDVGAVVINVTTLAFIGEYLETGMPLVNKCVTVDGSAVKEPKNVIAPIGTRLSHVFECAGGFKSEPEKVLYGGPMMGIAVDSLDAPILKMTNAVIAMDKKEAAPPETTACINCGSCLNHCPLRLDPRSIERAYKQNSEEDLEKLQVDLCMECGCCSFVCPARRPLVQTNKLAKAVLRNYIKKKEEEKNE